LLFLGEKGGWKKGGGALAPEKSAGRRVLKKREKGGKTPLTLSEQGLGERGKGCLKNSAGEREGGSRDPFNWGRGVSQGETLALLGLFRENPHTAAARGKKIGERLF